MKARVVCWLMFAALAACSASPEFRYYILSVEPGPKNTATIATPADCSPYAVDAVAIPDLLDRPQIVLRSGANAVEVLNYDRWAAPLADQLQRVFAADLSARLGADVIAVPGLPSPLRSGRRVTISILDFAPGRDGESVIAASWVVSDSKSVSIPAGVRVYRTRHVASTDRSDVMEVVATMSGLVGRTADDIAKTLAACE
jgi:uncharacterized protein